MTHLIDIDLLPNIGSVIDLGTAPIDWDPKAGLEFADAPYDFYDYIDTAFGWNASDNNNRANLFKQEFFKLLDAEIFRKGFSDNMQFTITMPVEFLAVSFNVCIYLDN
jgi:hypothetical protein